MRDQTNAPRTSAAEVVGSLVPAFCRAGLRLGFGLAAVCVACAQAPDSAADRGMLGAVGDLVDRMPLLLSNLLPELGPDNAVRIYSQPHPGDFFHSGYVRIPVGIRVRLSEHIETNTELLGYFAHGIEADSPAGLGTLRLGAKYEEVLSAEHGAGFSVGFDYLTPLAQVPQQFTDGYRHFQPYVTTTRMLVPKWGLLGYATFGLNFLESTSRPPNFVRNQLHGNSMALAVGVTRPWKRVQFSLTARVATMALMTDESHCNFWLRPEIAVPWQLRPGGRAQILFAVDSRVFWGPDGRQTSVGTGVRFQFNLDRSRDAKRVF